MDLSPQSPTPPQSRRSFLRRLVRGGAALAGVAGLGVGYGFWEASQIRVVRQTITLPRLRPSFEGKTIAVLADFHHGPFVGIDFIRAAVAMAQELAPDAYALVGDFAHKGKDSAEQLPLCLEVVSELRAPLGVYAVPGNHDMGNGGAVYRELIRTTPLTDLTNRAVRVSFGSDALWFAGIDDLWWGRPNPGTALHRVPAGEDVVLLCHNPDIAEIHPDPRVGVILSGHTHGGQVYLPMLGAPWIPSRYGDKYRVGLVQGPMSPVFVSRGLGEAGVPIRLNCPPEINLLTLTSGRQPSHAKTPRRKGSGGFDPCVTC
jgi:predicted MPP superfamily phosphohydrolase